MFGVTESGVPQQFTLPTIYAYVAFDGGDVDNLIASDNVESVTRTAKGRFTIKFTQPHSTGNYATIATAGNEDYSGTNSSPRGCGVVSRSESGLDLVVERSDDAVNEDNGYINVLVLG